MRSNFLATTTGSLALWGILHRQTGTADEIEEAGELPPVGGISLLGLGNDSPPFQRSQDGHRQDVGNSTPGELLSKLA